MFFVTTTISVQYKQDSSIKRNTKSTTLIYSSIQNLHDRYIENNTARSIHIIIVITRDF